MSPIPKPKRPSPVSNIFQILTKYWFKKLSYIDHIDEFRDYRIHTSALSLLLIYINKITGFCQEFKNQRNKKWIVVPFFNTFLKQWRLKKRTEAWLFVKMTSSCIFLILVEYLAVSHTVWRMNTACLVSVHLFVAEAIKWNFLARLVSNIDFSTKFNPEALYYLLPTSLPFPKRGKSKGARGRDLWAGKEN